MLVLSRKQKEVICIGPDIRVTIVEIRNCNGWSREAPKVRVGIDAPREVAVHRLEIFELLNGQHGENPNGEDETR
jgi:carbon storage regulator